jgi:pimeloyl-ACP methyl ester carboxylesterase
MFLQNGKAAMVERYIFLSGWGFTNTNIYGLSSDNCIIIDSNLLAVDIVENGTLNSNWAEILADKISGYKPSGEWTLAGWSMGAMMALGAATLLCPSCIKLFSPALSFVRDKNNPAGWRPAILASMRKALIKDRHSVMISFFEKCGFTQPYPESCHDIAALQAGLHFLEQANLENINPCKMPVEIYHGADDRIIPAASGKLVADKIGAEFYEMPGGHVFFLNSIC